MNAEVKLTVEKEKIDQFSFKVTQANKSQMVVIVYDIILDDLTSAKEKYEKGNVDEFTKDLKHAQKFVSELIGTLNHKYPISMDLMTLYLYVNKMIIKAMVQRKPDALDGLDEVVMKLRTAFDTISRTDYSGPVMHQTEQVYAGLTYNKNDLSEAYLDAGNRMKRGFTV